MSFKEFCISRHKILYGQQEESLRKPFWSSVYLAKTKHVMCGYLEASKERGDKEYSNMATWVIKFPNEGYKTIYWPKISSKEISQRESKSDYFPFNI